MSKPDSSPETARPLPGRRDAPSFSSDLQEAQRPEYIAFSHRDPFARDAYKLGFMPGLRENVYKYQISRKTNVDYPVYFLDNDHRDPDLERYQEYFAKYRPDVAIVGDANSRSEAREIMSVVRDLMDIKEFVPIVVPKCDCFGMFPDWVALGYPIGFSELSPGDYSQLDDWRGRNIHILGGNPHDQLEAIRKLTNPVATGTPPANIIGMDGNLVQSLAANWRKVWTEEKGKYRTDLSMRDRVRVSLENVKAFWKKHGLWPDWTPSKDHGPIMHIPDEMVYLDSGAAVGEMPEDKGIEYAVPGRYPDVEDAPDVAVFESESRKKFVEWREGWA